jgi:hypothetical protein
MAPKLSARGQRYRARTARGRANQQAPFAFLCAKPADEESRSHDRKHGWVVVNDAGEPLCRPTNRDEALKLRGATGGRLEER